MFVELNCIGGDGNGLEVSVEQTCGGGKGVQVCRLDSSLPRGCRASDPSRGFCHLTVRGRTPGRRKLPQPRTASSAVDCGGRLGRVCQRRKSRAQPRGRWGVCCRAGSSWGGCSPDTLASGLRVRPCACVIDSCRRWWHL